jgi:RNA polymerase sigma-70 factor (ECF subfamily)
MNAEQKKFISDLYHALYQFLVRYADSSLKNTALAEEAVQEAFSIACAKPTDVCSSPNTKGWMVNTVAYVIKNIESRQRTARQVIADLPEYRPDLVAAPPQSIDLRIIYGNLAETKEFKLVYAMAFEGKSIIELANELGVSVDTCKKRAERSRKYLQEKINQVSPSGDVSTYRGRKEANKCPR